MIIEMPRTKLLLLVLLALPVAAFDSKSEVAQLSETINRAAVAKDVDTLRKCYTSNYFSVTRNGVIRDLKSALDFSSTATVPPDLKKETLKTTMYGDTVLELVRETYTDTSGSTIEVHVTHVYVKQSGLWKLASRSATTVSTPK